MSTTTRKRGILLRLLDFGAIENELNADVGYKPMAVFERVDGAGMGRMYVVCVEGVGWEVSDRAPLKVDMYARPERANAIQIMATSRVVLDPGEVRELATGELVDLADLVRVFGARLESNFWQLHRELSGAVQVGKLPSPADRKGGVSS